jgi:RNA polymerase sigma-70 factor (ECF subfamily)
MNSDKNLYQTFVQGDISAFEELVFRHRHNLTYFIMQYVKSYHISEDIAQEVFAYIYVNPDKYCSNYEFKTYLFMIGKRRAIDYLRKNSRYTFLSVEAAEVIDYDSLENAIFQKEKDKVLREALNELKEEYRIVLMLVYLNGLSLAETAVVMNKSVSSVKILSHRAKKRLKQVLEKGGKIYEI